MRIFVGTQCDAAGEGVYSLELDEQDFSLSQPILRAELERPTWLLCHPKNEVLFAVSELGNRDERIGKLASFAIGEDGALDEINRVPAGGGGPTHLDIARDGSALFAANFGGGQAVCASVSPDGHLAENLSVVKQSGEGPHRRQKSAHPHGVTLDPSGRFLLVPDMGADRIFVHAYDSETKNIDGESDRAVSLPAGSGPRLTLFGKNGGFVYLLTELSAQIFVFEWNEQTGGLDPIQSLGLDDGAQLAQEGAEPSAAALAMSPDGRFLYVSNRRTHAIQAYAIDEQSGRIKLIQRVDAAGEKPWSAAVSPSGKSLLVTNQASDNVALFKRDEDSGLLSVKPAAIAEVKTPSCICF